MMVFKRRIWAHLAAVWTVPWGRGQTGDCQEQWGETVLWTCVMLWKLLSLELRVGL